MHTYQIPLFEFGEINQLNFMDFVKYFAYMRQKISNYYKNKIFHKFRIKSDNRNF